MKKSTTLFPTLVFAAIGIASLLAFHFSVPGKCKNNDDRSLLAQPVCTLHADQIEGVIWAEAALRARRPLNPNYSYPYAIPYGANIIMAPFVHFLGLRLLSNQLGMFVFSLLFLCVSAFLVRALPCDWLKAVIGTAVVFLAFRSRMGGNLLHHVLYYQLGCVCAMGMLAAVFRAYNRGSLTTFPAVFLTFFAAWSAANGGVTIILAAIPVVVALTVTRLQDRDGLSKPFWPCLGAIGAGVAIGLAAYFFAMRGIKEGTYIKDAGTYTFISLGQWLENIAEFPRTWIRLFVMYSPEGVEIGSLDGVETLFSLGMSLFILVFPVFWFAKYGKLDFHERVLLVFCTSIWAICLMQFVLFRSPATDRILYNGLFANYLLLGASVVKRLKHPMRFPWLIPLASMLLALWCVFFVFTARWKIDDSLIGELVSRGLTQGYATFWNASGNTVLSNGKVRVAPIVVTSEGDVTPWHFQSDASWYKLGPNVTDCFLLLEEDELEEARQLPNNMVVNLAKDHFTSQDFHVLVYSRNHWQEMLAGNAYSYNFKSNHWAIGCTSGEEGRRIHPGGVSYGPYMRMNKGVKCQVGITGENLEKANISVYGVAKGHIFIQPEYSLRTDSEIRFSFVSKVNLKKMEIAISNRANDSDVVLTSEVVEIFRPK